MAGVKVTICGVNTQELPLLSAKEKKELLLKIKAGDQTARERFIKGNLRLVLSIVGRFSNSNENVDDLFQIGCIGLIKSIDNFDVSQGVQFSTYAVPMITGEIKRYLRDNSAIRVSRSLKDMAYKALYTKEQLLKSRQKDVYKRQLYTCLTGSERTNTWSRPCSIEVIHLGFLHLITLVICFGNESDFLSTICPSLIILTVIL